MAETWSVFLLRNIDLRLLKEIKRDARRKERSMSDVIREILCSHYALDCPPSGRSTRLEFGARTQLLKIHPALFEAIKEDSAESEESMRGLILNILETHYSAVT